jgi:5,10-methylenetetrahydromethanopterin reductase
VRLAIRLSSDLAAPTLVEWSTAAEAAGLDSCWFSDNAYERSALISVAAVSQNTSRVRLGVGVASARARNPVLLAQDAMAIASFCQDRFVLGIGVGHEANRKILGLPRRSGLEILEETISVIRTLSEAGEVNLSQPGEPGARLRFETHRIPVLIGAVGPKTLRLAGRIADGFITSLGSSWQYLERANRIGMEGWQQAGRRDVFEHVAYVIYGGNAPADEARRRLKPVVAKFARSVHNNPGLLTMFEGTALTRPVNAELARRIDAGESVEETVTADMVDDVTIWGEPSVAIAKLEHLASVGVTEVALGVGHWLPASHAMGDVADLATAWAARQSPAAI